MIFRMVSSSAGERRPGGPPSPHSRSPVHVLDTPGPPTSERSPLRWGSRRRPGRRARQRALVDVPDLIDPLGEPPAVTGALVAVVVHRVVLVRPAVEQVDELLDVGTAVRGVALQPDDARVGVLDGGPPNTRLSPATT